MQNKTTSSKTVLSKTALSKTALSKSKLWQKQREFYQQQGIEAWNNKVPFYATCNTNVANAYANIILSFIADYKEEHNQRHLDSHRHPVYIVELGTGTGALSFNLVKQLRFLEKKYHLTTDDYTYVMSDMVPDNIRFWQQKSAFQNHIENSSLDFALFDLEKDNDIHLKYSGTTISKRAQSPIISPIIFIANYLFDTLPHDVFKVENGRLKEGVVNHDTDIVDMPLNQGVYLDKLDSELTYRPIAMPYYEDDAINHILSDYRFKYDQHSFTLPIGSLRAGRKLKEISSGKFLLLATDKGYSSHPAWHEQMPPDLVFHSQCFSMTVNFCAIGQYFQWKGGDFYHQDIQQGITTSAFLWDDTFNSHPRTSLALKENLDALSPGNLFNLYRSLETNRFAWPLEAMVAFLAMSQWDSYIFNACLDSILAQAKQTTMANPVLDDLCRGMPHIADNVYGTPGAVDTLANIGLFFQEIQQYPEALHYYRRALDSGKYSDTTLYNMGLCLVHLGDHTEALEHFNAAVALNPNYIQARGWIAHIETTQKKSQSIPPRPPTNNIVP